MNTTTRTDKTRHDAPLGAIVGTVLRDFARYAEQAYLDSTVGPLYPEDGPDFDARWTRHLTTILAGTDYTPESLLSAVRDRTSPRWTHFAGLDDALASETDSEAW